MRGTRMLGASCALLLVGAFIAEAMGAPLASIGFWVAAGLCVAWAVVIVDFLAYVVAETFRGLK